ncbi:DUF975 family protein [Clostridium sediminicola]|uniref:DUF975 family protein n=1 Tax=Clostridium sediminicola TaxID=3114879 RepID=UPI0031F25AEF
MLENMQFDKSKIMKIKEIKRQALDSLSGRWGTAILVCFIYFILLSSISITIGGFTSINILRDFTLLSSYNDINQYANQTSTSQLILNLNQLINLVIAGPLIYGLSGFFLNIIRKNNIRIENLFSGFKRFGKSFLLNLVISIFTVLWWLAIMLPVIIISVIIITIIIMTTGFNEGMNSVGNFESSFGIFISFGIIIFLVSIIAFIICTIIIFRYKLAYYIYVDNNDYDIMDCIKQSKIMMKGFKIKLFLLYLSFIGWWILSCISLGIGFLWLTPYIQTSTAIFYENLKDAYFGEEEKLKTNQ